MSGIWVLAEHADGELARVSFELLGEAVRLSRKLDTSVAALVLADGGESLTEALARHGADTVYLIEDPRLRHYDPDIAVASIARLCRLRDPVLVMFAATSTGSDLAVRLAVSEDWPLVPCCVNFLVRDGELELVRSFAQRGVHGVFTGSRPGPTLSTIMPDTIGVERPDPARRATVERFAAAVPERSAIDVCDFIAGDPRTLELSEAEIVVAAGRGIGARDNIRLVQEFADAIGASVACTRPVVDLGWLPRSRQVGQTGTSVKPRLYVACGISGATQHTVGMRDAGTIVAINSDRGAPIFGIADLGIVGDVTRILPALTKRCRIPWNE